MSTYKITTVPDSFWLKVHISDFLNSLVQKGYTKGTIEDYKNSAARICDHAEALRIGPEDLDAELLDKLATTCPGTGSRYMEGMLHRTVRRITDDLIDKGVISKPPEDLSIGGPREHLILELDNWLKSNRGLYGGGISRHHKVARLFLDYFGKRGDQSHMPLPVDKLLFLTINRGYVTVYCEK